MGVPRAPAMMLFVAFKYDLGGSIVDTQQLIDVLAAQHGAVTIDPALLRSSNAAYLARHAPVVSCDLPDGEIDLAGSRCRYSSRLRAYSWLGVVSIDYTLALEDGTVDAARLFDDLMEWKNRDYLPYLRDCQALSDSLRRQIPGGHESAAVDLHGSFVRNLRGAVSSMIEPRPFLYPFHDFRMCFIGDIEVLPDERVWQLLWLSAHDSVTPESETLELLRFRDLDVVGSLLSTVVRGEHTKIDVDTEPIIMLLNLMHAQWYLCRLWIDGYDLRRQEPTAGWQPADAHVLSANQSALAQDLAEIDNLNVMFRDPGLLRLARYLEACTDVRRQKETAMTRLRVLENHSRQLADYANEMELRRFQALFAISAAAGVASLVPALAQVGFSLIHVVTTIVPLLSLWGLFAVNFAAMRRRWATRRR